MNKNPSFREYLKHRDEIINSEKQKEDRKEAALSLYNEKTFYRSFVKDMLEADKEIIIYSPFISKFRTDFFSDTLKKLRRKNIAVFIFTRPLEEHEYFMRSEIKCALNDYEEMGACIFYLPGSIHEKAAIIDRKTLWEGSLNILSQRHSHEMMRRIFDEDSAKQVMAHLGLNKKLAEGYKDKYERMYRSLVANSRENNKLKIRAFLTGFVIPIITWWFILNFRVMILGLKSIRMIMNIIKNLI
ncbi:MAG: phospholipase D-like domain-containing protein [Patescibacteria group bacterium]